MMKIKNFMRLTYLYNIFFPLLTFMLYLWMALLPDLRLSVPEWILISAIIMIILVLTVFTGQSNQTSWSSGFIIAMAAIFRAMFLWRSPELSDDIYRYVFDGLMLLSGRNPYEAAPADMAAGDMSMAGLVHLINHADLPTIYPPAAQFVFAIGAYFGGIFGMKLTFVLLDIFTCLLMARLLAALGLPRNRVVLYAWHPLPIIEIGASGHMDTAAIFFTFMSFVFLLTVYPGILTNNLSVKKISKLLGSLKCSSIFIFFSGVFFAAAVLSKWFPLIFLPGLMGMIAPGRRRFAGYGFMLACVAIFAVFWPDVRNCFYTLSVYASNWEFSGFAFRCLRASTESGTVARAILSIGFVMTIFIIYRRSIKTATDGFLDIFKSFYFISMAFMFFTPTLHPWYGLYLVAFLPFAAGPAGLAFSWSVLLAYRVVILYSLTGQWIENDFVPFLIVSAPPAAFVLNLIIKMAIKKRSVKRIF
jgi:hypothetical protein